MTKLQWDNQDRAQRRSGAGGMLRSGSGSLSGKRKPKQKMHRTKARNHRTGLGTLVPASSGKRAKATTARKPKRRKATKASSRVHRPTKGELRRMEARSAQAAQAREAEVRAGRATARGRKPKATPHPIAKKPGDPPAPHKTWRDFKRDDPAGYREAQKRWKKSAAGKASYRQWRRNHRAKVRATEKG